LSDFEEELLLGTFFGVGAPRQPAPPAPLFHGGLCEEDVRVAAPPAASAGPVVGRGGAVNGDADLGPFDAVDGRWGGEHAAVVCGCVAKLELVVTLPVEF